MIIKRNMRFKKNLVKSKSNEVFIKKSRSEYADRTFIKNNHSKDNTKTDLNQQAAYINISNITINKTSKSIKDPNKNLSDCNKNNYKIIFERNANKNNSKNQNTMNEDKSYLLLNTIREYDKDPNSYAYKYNYNHLLKDKEKSLNSKKMNR